jgi:hypothetical protein
MSSCSSARKFAKQQLPRKNILRNQTFFVKNFPSA